MQWVRITHAAGRCDADASARPRGACAGLSKPGPALGPWVERLVRWELRTPGASKEQALSWLQEQAAAEGAGAGTARPA